MNESSRGEGGGGDPPISGGFPPPPHLKEEFPSPPSSAQGQATDLQLGAFGQDDLDDLDHNLVGDGFTLSRLLGGDSSSPTATHWDTLNESLATAGNPTPPSNQSVPTSSYENSEFQKGYENSGPQSLNNPSNPGYRPWEAEQTSLTSTHYPPASQNASHVLTATTVAATRGMHAPPSYYATQPNHNNHAMHHFNQPHLPSFQSQFNFNENIPPPNTQAPAGPPVPTTASNRYTLATSQQMRISTPQSHQFQSLELTASCPTTTPSQYPHIQAALSPNKFPGRVMVKARRPSQHNQHLQNQQRQQQQQQQQQQQCSPGKFSDPGTPATTPVPPNNMNENTQRPASASGLSSEGNGIRGNSTPGPHTTPNSPVMAKCYSDNSAQFMRMDAMLTGDVRGKVRTASLEGSESDNSVRSLRSESDPGLADTPGQVAAISSTDPTPDTITGLAEAFKPPPDLSQGNSSPGLNLNQSLPHHADTHEKPTKKKRKRCGECTGCQRKDNCGDCAPCRNEKSHQICKMRRCDRLTEKKPRKNGSFGADFAGQMFPQGPAWGGNDPGWYGAPMGPPSGHNPHNRPTAAQITFDNAYNFTGSAHVMPQPMQDFSVQLPQHHPFSLPVHDPGHPGNHGHGPLRSPHPPQSPVNGLGNRAPPTATFMHEPSGYGGLNGQGIPYHVNVTSDKNLLLAPGLGGMGGVRPGLQHHQGNLQPGYPPRPVEISSHSSDSVSSTSLTSTTSTGYPGMIVTGPPTQEQRVSSSRQDQTKGVPPDIRPSQFLMTDSRSGQQFSNLLSTQTVLHSPVGNNQPTFLACSAAEELVMGDTHTVQVSETKLENSTTSSSNLDKSLLARTSTAPLTENWKPPKIEDSKLFVSSLKALQNSTSKNNSMFRSRTKIITILDKSEKDVSEQKSTEDIGEEMFPRLDGNFDIDEIPQSPELKQYQPFQSPNKQTGEIFKTPNRDSPMKGKRHQLEGKDEENSSIRTPLEVLKDVFEDKEILENLTNQQQQVLKMKAAKLKEISPSCNCAAMGLNVDDNGPFYIQLGYARTLSDMRSLFERRLGVTGRKALRIEKVRFTGREGVTSEGCPIAKWVIRRSNQEEKYCIIVKNRYGHQCEYAWIAVSQIQWDGLSQELADTAYEEISGRTAKYGSETERMCGANKKKTCACQGLNNSFNGASYTFGCSWTMYQNVCKFCRSSEVHKFRLKDASEEINLDKICQQLTDAVTPSFGRMAPDCYNNMCLFDEVAGGCRIGTQPGRPFSGITTVCDYCAHSHKDNNNMIGGCTVVVTLTRPENRTLAKVDDEQFHVLPQYVPDATPEEVQEMIASGGLEVLSKFQRTITVRERPKKPNCKRGRPTAEKKKMLDGYVPEGYTDDKHYQSPKGRGRSLSGSPASRSPKGRGVSPAASLGISDSDMMPRPLKNKKPKEVWTTSQNKSGLNQQKVIKMSSMRPTPNLTHDYPTHDITLDARNNLDNIGIDYSYNNQNGNQLKTSLNPESFPSNNWNTSRVLPAKSVIRPNYQHQVTNKIQVNRNIQINRPNTYQTLSNYTSSNPQNSSIMRTAQNFTRPNSAQFQISQNSPALDQRYGQIEHDQRHGLPPNISRINSEIRQQPRKIVISNPVIYRQQETQPYIPRIPNVQTSQRPTGVPKHFISNIEAQFDDSILNLLDEPTDHHQSENQQEPASLIYANYLNNLPQVDGTSDLDPEQIYASYTNRLNQQTNYAAPSYSSQPDVAEPVYYGSNSTATSANYYSRVSQNVAPPQANTITQNVHARLPPQRYAQPQNFGNRNMYHSSNNGNFASPNTQPSLRPQTRLPPPRYSSNIRSVPLNQASRPQNIQPPPRYNSVNRAQIVQHNPRYTNPVSIVPQNSNQIRVAPPIYQLHKQAEEELMQNIPPLTPIQRYSKSPTVQNNMTNLQSNNSNQLNASLYSDNIKSNQNDQGTANFSSSFEKFLSNRPSASSSSLPSSISSVILDDTPLRFKPVSALYQGIEQSGFSDVQLADVVKKEEKPEINLRDFIAQPESNSKDIAHIEEVKEEKPTVYESDCIEAFQDASIGGIALALPHGSILVEVAKHELHATTALKNPNRHNPCRIGLVFYQHKNLHFANHGADEFLKKNQIREHRDYIQWLKGCFVPSSTKLGTMQKSGFCFPSNVITIKPSQESKPEDRFHPEAYPGFIPGKYVDGKFVKIDVNEDYSYEIFKGKLTSNSTNQGLNSGSVPVQGQGPYTEHVVNNSISSNFSGQSIFNSSEQSLTNSPFNFYSE